MMPLRNQLGPLGRSLGATAAFLPTDISGLRLWLKSDAGLFQNSNGTTPATADGDPVGYWTDQSSLGNNAVQATAAWRPARQSGPRLTFDNADDKLVTATIAHGIGTGDFLFVAVVRSPAVGAGYRAMASNGSYAPAFYVSSGKLVMYHGGDFVFNTTLSSNTWYLIEVSRVSSILSAVINGAVDSTTFSYSANAADAVMWVGHSGSGSEIWNGDMKELLWVVGNPSSQRADLRAYLNTKWAIY